MNTILLAAFLLNAAFVAFWLAYYEAKLAAWLSLLAVAMTGIALAVM